MLRIYRTFFNLIKATVTLKERVSKSKGTAEKMEIARKCLLSNSRELNELNEYKMSVEAEGDIPYLLKVVKKYLKTVDLCFPI